MMYDVAVVGGGACGLAAAVKLKTDKPFLNVVLLEKLDRVGKKLITTGNGRCNITNKFAEISNYHSENILFVQKIFSNFFVDDTLNFFKKIGTEIRFENDGKAYPASYQASSVVDSLRFACEDSGVNIITNFAVDDISFSDKIVLNCGKESITAKSVLLCAGLYSGGESVGSDGSLFKLLKNSGYKAVKTSPAIVQIKTENAVTRQLKGIKVNAVATIKAGDKNRSEYGEVLFTDYGLSGPVILQISRLIKEQGEKTVTLNLLPEYSFENLFNLLCERRKNLANRKNENFLVGFINKRLGQIILKNEGILLAESVNSLTDSDISKIANRLQNFEFKVLGDMGYKNSQVTAGGISLSEINDDMQSKKHKGVFFGGELLDVDGDCGGYNLQWAWSSAFAAAEGIEKYLGV